MTNYVSSRHSLILYANDRCATESICNSLQMKPVPEEPSFMAGEFRTLLVVRDPIQRFLSACASVNSTPENALSLLESAKGAGEYPKPFRSQAPLIRRRDYVVGMPWLSEFWNHFKLPTLKKENALQPAHRPRPVPEGLEGRLRAVYSRDFDLLGMGEKKVRLWSPDQEEFRFIWGDCSECRAKHKSS